MSSLRELRRAQNRAGTVDAALALFSQRGYDEVTVADICAAADIAPRTFFRYFAGKDDLLLEPVREMAARMRVSLAAAPAGRDAGAVLRDGLVEVGAYAVAHRTRLTAFRAVLRASPGAASRGSAMSVLLPDQETALAADLAACGPGEGGAPGWRLRLLVAVQVAAFRVWLEEHLTAPDGGARPLDHLREVLAAVACDHVGAAPDAGRVAAPGASPASGRCAPAPGTRAGSP